MLTGDKQETAINIGYSCQLLDDNQEEPFIVDGDTREEVEAQLGKYLTVVAGSGHVVDDADRHKQRNYTSSQTQPHPPQPAESLSMSTLSDASSLGGGAEYNQVRRVTNSLFFRENTTNEPLYGQNMICVSSGSCFLFRASPPPTRATV